MLRVHRAGIAAPPSSASILLGRDFALLTVANFALFASMQSLVPTLPLYVAQLGGAEALVGIVSGAFVLAAVAVRPWLGGLLDDRGRRGVLIGSFVVFAAASLLYPLATTIWALLAVRVVQGIGWGGAIPAAGTIVADVVPMDRRGEGMAYFGLSPTLAMALAPAAALTVVRTLGFLPLFMASAACAALAAALVMPVRDSRPASRSGGDHAKGFVETAALGPSLVAGVLTFTMGGITTFVAVDSAQRATGDPAVFFLVYAGVLLVTRPVAGWLSDRRGRGSVLVPGVALIVIGLVVLGAAPGPWTLPVAAVLYGVGFGSAQPALQALVVDQASPERRGAAISAYYVAFDLGVGLGTVLFGVAGGVVGLPLTFQLAAGVALAALVGVAASGLRRSRRSSI